MVSVAMPSALSVTVIVPFLATLISISGATSASSAASRALSTSSLSTTSGQLSTSWPVWLTNSFSLQNSVKRETVKAKRVSLCSFDRRRSGFATFGKNCDPSTGF